MLKRFFAIPLTGFAICLSLAAHGAEPPPSGRYTMSPTDGGFIRLDTLTGDVSLCAKADADWSCRAMPDGEKTLRSENDRLRAELKSLKDEVARLEEALGLGPPKPGDEGAGPQAQNKLQLPSEEDLDKAFDYFESMVRKLQERLKKLEKPEPPTTPL